MQLEEVKENANYCLNCKIKPCSLKGCPLGNQIPEFIAQIKQEEYKKAYEILAQTTVLQGICGRICPHQKQCEGVCVRGIRGVPVSIGALEAFVYDQVENDENILLECYKEEMQENPNYKNKKVAVIGGGPAGITCAAFLVRKGIQVTIYEKKNYLGGLLVHGIPEFRLPKEIVKNSMDKILKLGITVEYNKALGKDITIEQLEQDYDAIFLGVGANVSSKMGVPGEDKKGVYGGNELLEYHLHPSYEGKSVAVVGGGNVAMDCARTIQKSGAKEVKVIYRRAREQMPAEAKEIEEAIEEGVTFLFQNNIIEIMGKDKVEQVELIKTELVQKEGETRLVPQNVAGSNYIIDTDYIVMALGAGVEEYVKQLPLEKNKWGNIQIKDNYQTSHPKVYAGGDVAGVKGTVAWAANSGREAAKAIINTFETKNI